AKFRPVWKDKSTSETIQREYRRAVSDDLNYGSVDDFPNKRIRIYRQDNIVSQKPPGSFPVIFQGRSFVPKTGYWKTGQLGMSRLVRASRIETRGWMLSYVRFMDDFPVMQATNQWGDVKFSSRSEDKSYVVQSSEKLVERCVLM